MKKVGKITRPFRYDPNKIPCDYTMEVTNRFKELDMRDRGLQHCTGGNEQNHLKGKKMQDGKIMPCK